MKLYNHNQKKKNILTKDIDDKYSLLISGVAFIAISIYFFINTNYLYSIIAIVLGIGTLIFSYYRFKNDFNNKKLDKVMVAYQGIIEDINSENIKSQLAALGFKEDNIDYIIGSDWLQFGISYDEFCYFNACISRKYYEFAIEITDDVLKNINCDFSDAANDIIDVYQTSDMNASLTKEDIYQAFLDYVNKHQNEVELVSREAKALYK